MSISGPTHTQKLESPWPKLAGPDEREQRQSGAIESDLQFLLACEQRLRNENKALLQREDLLAQELERRIFSGLQLIAVLLASQRKAARPETAELLTITAGRVSALGRVHHRLHLLNREDNLEFKKYLEQLCEDLSALLHDQRADSAIEIKSAEIEIPISLSIPLRFVINQLMTDSVTCVDLRNIFNERPENLCIDVSRPA